MTKSSNNVFVDLGFDLAESVVLQIRSNLMSDLRLYIERRKLTQSEAVKPLGIAQSRVSASFGDFSLILLITLGACLGCIVRMEFST